MAVGVLAAAGLAVGIGAASAHVVVDPSTAAPGTELAVLTFRVPNESAKANTVGITITMPTKTPFATVRYKDVPGWTAKATTTHLATPIKEGDLEVTDPVTSVTFTADSGTKIEPGAFADFELEVGPLPDVASLAFPTNQSYDDGSVVKWADATPAGGEEPEHPSPTLTLGDAPAAGSDAAASPSVHASPAAGSSTEAVAASSAVSSSDGTARTLGVIGIIGAALSLLVSAVGLSRRPRRQSSVRTDPAGPSS
ncbi:MAG: YcnI family copper-binding membrane protein [Nakamurella sp.]